MRPWPQGCASTSGCTWRALATKTSDLSRARVNDAAAKPHRELKLGDRIEAEVTLDWTRVLVVRELAARTMLKADVARLFENLSLPRPGPDPYARALRRPPVVRAKGADRPTK